MNVKENSEMMDKTIDKGCKGNKNYIGLNYCLLGKEIFEGKKINCTFLGNQYEVYIPYGTMKVYGCNKK